MFDILLHIPGRRKITGKGWYSFNAVCCHHRGHKADRRSRGGIKMVTDSEWTYHCFNCNYSAHYKLGQKLSRKTKSLLQYLGLSAEDIGRIELDSLRNRDLLDIIKPEFVKRVLKFDNCSLPETSELLDINRDDHYPYLKFIIDRGLNPLSYPYIVTSRDVGRNSKRIIIPYFYRGNIVGYTSRYIDIQKDSIFPKYVKNIPSGFLFGLDFQKPEWQNVILCEGEFDAIAIQATATLTNSISDDQAYLLSRLHKPVIVVPDQDRSGLKIIERALSLGYRISLPPWHSDVKDINDAVKRYGVIATLKSIHESATRSKIIIDHAYRRISK